MAHRCQTCRTTDPTRFVLVVGRHRAQLSAEARTCLGCDAEHVRPGLAADVAGKLHRSPSASGPEFKWCRDYLGLRQSQVAGLLDVSVETVGRWERGSDEVPRPSWLILRQAIASRLTVDACPAPPSTVCLYCGGPLDGSVEHILLNVLGGRLTSARLTCSSCNNRLGRGPHAALATALRPLLVVADATTGDRRSQPPLRNVPTLDGTPPVDLLPGSRPEARQVHVHRSTDANGKETITIIAPSLERAEEIAAQIAGARPTEMTVTHRVSRPRLDLHLSVGGDDHSRAVASMALGLLAWRVGTDICRSDAFEPIREFILAARPDEGLVRWALGTDLRIPAAAGASPNLGLWTQIAVSADPETGFALGRIRVLGALAWEVVLASAWAGPRVGCAYGVDPVAGIELGPVEFQPWSAPVTAQSDYLGDPERAKEAIAHIVTVSQRRSWEGARERLAGEVAAQAVAEVFGGLPEGELILPEHVNALSSPLTNG